MNRTDIFRLDDARLNDIAQALAAKIEEGLAADGGELLCLPTYITPAKGGIRNESALVLDLGGTNYRVAVVEFDAQGKPVIHPDNGWQTDLSVIKSDGFTREDLFREQADPIESIRIDKPMPIGYCFSFPAESLEDGDARLVHWNKGIHIDEMTGQEVGKPLMEYFNRTTGAEFTGIKVINDTVASLFAGAARSGYDGYIGLIVGTGTNMAPFMPAEGVGKLAGRGIDGTLPINLESGNFVPPHMTEYDAAVDAASDTPGLQRFEKAISGYYLGEVLKAVFPSTVFERKFDAGRLNDMMNYPDIYKPEYVETARAIYQRSACLVAASIAGLVKVMHRQNPAIRRILLTAEGGLYWSRDRNGTDYNDMVNATLTRLLALSGLQDVVVEIIQMDNANLIGTAVAALS
jgi:hexokinase